MNPEELVTRIPELTEEEEQTIRQALRDGEKWQNYYKGGYTIIRTDKLATLNQARKKLLQLQGTQANPQHTYCPTCGTKTKTMPCDPELTYCPQCHLPHNEEPTEHPSPNNS